MGWDRIYVGVMKRDEKSLNLTNSIPKSFRINYIFTESFRKMRVLYFLDILKVCKRLTSPADSVNGQ